MKTILKSFQRILPLFIVATIFTTVAMNVAQADDDTDSSSEVIIDDSDESTIPMEDSSDDSTGDM